MASLKDEAPRVDPYQPNNYLVDGKVTLGASPAPAAGVVAGVVLEVGAAEASAIPASARRVATRCAQMLWGLSVES